MVKINKSWWGAAGSILVVLAVGISNYGIRNAETLSPQPTPTPKVLVSDTLATDLDRNVLLEKINVWRVSLDLEPWEPSVITCDIANQRAMIVYNRGEGVYKDLTHDGFLELAARSEGQLFGENLASTVARGKLKEADILTIWLESPSHRELIEHPSFTEACVGTYGTVVDLVTRIP